MSKNVIPPITDPLGRHWTQPKLKDVLIDDTHAVMSQASFNMLAEYSCSMPSGAYVGKMFSRHDGAYDPRCKPEDRRWLLVWFGDHADKTKVSINYREILIAD